MGCQMFFFFFPSSGPVGLFTLPALHGGGLVLGPGCWEVETALCSSFIRQMSPSQAMNNRRAPSVRRHPPGPVGSLLPSVPCHGLAPTACLRQHLSFLFFPPFLFPGTARSCFLSVRLHPSALSVSFFFRPTSFLYHPICSPRFLRPSRPNQTHKQIVGEKKQ